MTLGCICPKVGSGSTSLPQVTAFFGHSKNVLLPLCMYPKIYQECGYENFSAVTLQPSEKLNLNGTSLQYFPSNVI